MTTGNAWGFVFLGIAMSLLPVIAPGSFPATGIDGSSARALWVEVMGAIQFILGATYLVRHNLLPAAVRWLNAEPAEPVATIVEPVGVGENPAPVGVAEVLPFGDALEPAGLFATSQSEPDDLVLHHQHAVLRRVLQLALVDRERLMHFLERLRVLAHRHGERAWAHGAAPLMQGYRASHRLFHLIQAGVLDLEELRHRGGDWLREPGLRALLGKITDDVDEIVADNRRAA